MMSIRGRLPRRYSQNLRREPQNWYSSNSRVRIEILLLISTFLFGITIQILDKYGELTPDLKGLLFEILILWLFGAYFYMLVSWGNLNKPEKAREYEQVSITQLLVLNGIMVSILVSYATSLIGAENQLFGQSEQGLYLIVLLFIFVILPVVAYSRTLAPLGTLVGIYPSEKIPETPVIIAMVPMTFFIILVFSLLLFYSSKVLNVVSMASLVIYLPYLGIKSKEDIQIIGTTHKRSIERGLAYLLIIYRSYFLTILLASFYDFYAHNLKSNIYVWVLLSLLIIAEGISLFLLKRGPKWTVLGMIFLVLAGGITVYLIFIRDISLLGGSIFLMYLVFVGSYILVYILMYIGESISQFIYKTLSDRLEL